MSSRTDKTIKDIVSWLDEYLQIGSFLDSSLNGVQVGGWEEKRVTKVCVAVDAGESVLEKAVKEEQGDLIIVHHGLFWGEKYLITGALLRKIEALILSRATLYAAHLPLDGHQEVGNAAQLAKVCGLDEVQPFFRYEGSYIGVKGRTEAKGIDFFVQKISELRGARNPLVLDFGKKEIETVGIITGSGAFALDECAKEGIDLFITGEPKQFAYHMAKELRQDVIFGGHYATEVLGVVALGEKIRDQFDIPFSFIDEPTGI